MAFFGRRRHRRLSHVELEIVKEVKEVEEGSKLKFEHLCHGVIELPHYSGLSVFAQCPDPIWLDIIDHIADYRDLYNLIRSCSKLHRLALRKLYQDVCFQKFINVERNKEFWIDRKDSLATATRSLTLGSNSSSAATHLSRFCVGPLNDHGHPRKGGFFSEKNWDDTVVPQILHLPNLTQLRINALALPQQFFTVLVQLPYLRDLCISECGLHEPAELDWFSQTLPVTNLTLKSVKWNLSSFRWSRREIKFINSLPNLRKLRMDWDVEIASSVVRQGLLNFRFPKTVEFLELRTFPQSNWPEAHGTSDPVLTTSLIALLRASTSILSLRVNGFMPCLPLSPVAMGQLRSYTGPLMPVKSLLYSNQVMEELLITDFDCSIQQFTSVLTYQPTLCTLKILMTHWDIEVMHAVVHLFPNLVELRILYQVGYPDDDILISLGAEFLSRLPRLQKFHLYNPRIIYSCTSENRQSIGLPTCVSQITLGPCAEPEFTNDGFLGAWKRYTPDLKEVRLVKDFVWRRDVAPHLNSGQNGWFKAYPEHLEKEIGAIQEGWEVDPEF